MFNRYLTAAALAAAVSLSVPTAAHATYGHYSRDYLESLVDSLSAKREKLLSYGYSEHHFWVKAIEASIKSNLSKIDRMDTEWFDKRFRYSWKGIIFKHCVSRH